MRRTPIQHGPIFARFSDETSENWCYLWGTLLARALLHSMRIASACTVRRVRMRRRLASRLSLVHGVSCSGHAMIDGVTRGEEEGAAAQSFSADGTIVRQQYHQGN